MVAGCEPIFSIRHTMDLSASANIHLIPPDLKLASCARRSKEASLPLSFELLTWAYQLSQHTMHILAIVPETTNTE